MPDTETVTLFDSCRIVGWTNKYMRMRLCALADPSVAPNGSSGGIMPSES